jgi:UDP:flavonoid glycosyltransferase YjiC (YdhE family)
MRVLFTCWPFEGHVFGQMSIAQALVERGDEVAFYTGEAMRPKIEAAGIQVFPFTTLSADHYLNVHRKESESSARGQSLRASHEAFRNWTVESIPDQVTDITRIVEAWQPDVIAADLSMWGPPLVLWEKLGIPVAISSTMMGPMIPGPDAPPWGFGLKPPHGLGGKALGKFASVVTDVVAAGMRRRLDEIRADNGLGPMGCSVNEFTGRLPLYLVGNLPELDYDRHDLPATVHYTGHNLWHPPEQRSVLDWLDTISTEYPWVHVTEGTSHHQSEPFLLRAAVQGLANGPMEVIATTGSQRDPDDLGLGVLAPNVRVAKWVSHSELLPRCAAVVTTGGQATVMSALAAGVPLVIAPTTWDKPDNCRRVTEAGVGIKVPPKKCSPERLRAAVDEVLTDPRYRANAQRIASRLAAAPGPKQAAELLEALPAGAVRVR